MLQFQHESNVIFEWVASLLCILEILVIPTIFVIFRSPFPQTPTEYLSSGCGYFEDHTT
jgi:ABC-type phosphate transport system permease subunit